MAKAKTADGYTLGIDLGGTKILAGVVDAAGNVKATGKKTTNAQGGPESVIKRVQKACDDAMEKAGITLEQVQAIGIGVPGPVDSEKGIVRSAANLPGWVNIELAKELKKWRNVPVALSNDVRVACVGEHRAGIGKGCKNLITIFVGTGIGGGIVINDQIYTGSRWSAAEIGHMILMPDGPYPAGTGVRGGVETLASRTAIDRDLRAGIAAGIVKTNLPKLMEEKGGAITSSVLKAAVDEGDPLTISVLQRAAYYLGLHAATLINAFDPEMLIYGGGVIEGLGEWLLKLIRPVAYANAVNKFEINKIKIVEAKLGERAGVIGAALLARDLI
jgi:glucokinase